MVSLNSRLSAGNKPPMNGLGRPRTQAANTLENLRSRLTRSIDRNPGQDGGDLSSVNGRERAGSQHRRNDSQGRLRDATLRKLSKFGGRETLMEQVKGMNEEQLQKVSKYLNVRVGDGTEELAADYADLGPSASIISQNEADELADRVDDLQNALL